MTAEIQVADLADNVPSETSLQLTHDRVAAGELLVELCWSPFLPIGAAVDDEAGLDEQGRCEGVCYCTIEGFHGLERPLEWISAEMGREATGIKGPFRGLSPFVGEEVVFKVYDISTAVLKLRMIPSQNYLGGAVGRIGKTAAKGVQPLKWALRRGGQRAPHEADMGTATVPMGELMERSNCFRRGRFPIESSSSDVSCGYVDMKMYLRTLDMEVPVQRQIDHHGETALGVVRMRIISARGLPNVDLLSKSDPYCIARMSPVLSSFDEFSHFETPHIDNELNPTWDSLPAEFVYSDDDAVLTFDVMDHERLRRGRMLGQISIKVDDLPADQVLRVSLAPPARSPSSAARPLAPAGRARPVRLGRRTAHQTHPAEARASNNRAPRRLWPHGAPRTQAVCRGRRAARRRARRPGGAAHRVESAAIRGRPFGVPRAV